MEREHPSQRALRQGSVGCRVSPSETCIFCLLGARAFSTCRLAAGFVRVPALHPVAQQAPEEKGRGARSGPTAARRPHGAQPPWAARGLRTP